MSPVKALKIHNPQTKENLIHNVVDPIYNFPTFEEFKKSLPDTFSYTWSWSSPWTQRSEFIKKNSGTVLVIDNGFVKEIEYKASLSKLSSIVTYSFTELSSQTIEEYYKSQVIADILPISLDDDADIDDQIEENDDDDNSDDQPVKVKPQDVNSQVVNMFPIKESVYKPNNLQECDHDDDQTKTPVFLGDDKGIAESLIAVLHLNTPANNQGCDTGETNQSIADNDDVADHVLSSEIETDDQA
jgi:hypothetical protein